MEIDHVGYLVNDIKKSICYFTKLGYTQASDVICDTNMEKNRNVYLCFMKNNYYKIELVSPVNESSDIYNFIKGNGEGPYHICYKTKNFENELDRLKKESWIIVQKPASAVAFNYAKVAFLYKIGIGLIELLEME